MPTKSNKTKAVIETPAPRPVAYSYTRFSSPEQGRGDSYRRQTELAQAYADANGLDLDVTTRFHDAGVSGYRGANSRTGKLREFMRLVEEEHIAEGSYLLVENLDRISRQDPWDALPVFQFIINQGITIVTLQDQKVWSRDIVRGNPVKIMESLFTMINAHDESAKKGKRLRAVWQQKRKLAKTVKMSAKCPAWLVLAPDRKVFRPVPGRANVVKRIFKLASEGVGQHKIAATLNSEAVPTFQNGKHWHRSYIAKMLRNESVVGTYTPHVITEVRDKRVRKPLEKVKNYYPRVISDDLWSKVQALSSTRSSLRGRHAKSATLSNVLAGLCRCGRCGSTMTLVSKNKRDRYLVCTKAKTAAGCTYRSVRYRDVEEQLLETKDLWMVRDLDIGSEHPEADKLRDLRSNIEAAQDALVEIGVAKTPAVRTSIAELTASIERLEEEEKALAQRIAQSVPRLVQRRIDDAYDALCGSPLDRTEANRRLRLVLDEVRFDFATGHAELSWKHGALTSWMFRWPEDAH